MPKPLPYTLMLLATATACGSRRVAGYLEDLENCSITSSTTDDTETTRDASDTTLSSDSSGTTIGVSETAGTSTTQASTGTTDTTGTTADSTGEPIAECGNGTLEAFGPVPEECDDGNLDPDDGCSDTCALDRRVFVSSLLYMGGELESLYIADALCANHAGVQGWPDPLKYNAWLSDSKTDARDRFIRGRGRLVMRNGLVFATSWPALFAGMVENPLDVTDEGLTYQGEVWTGTRPDGIAVPDSTHCEDWGTKSVLPTGYYGYSNKTTAEWTLAVDADQPSPCNSDYAIYCFQSL